MTTTEYVTATGTTVLSTVPVGAVYSRATELNYSAPLVPGRVVLDDIVEPLAPWSAVIRAGAVLTIIDVGGNQSADCLMFNANDTDERYSAAETMTWQRNA